MPIIIGLLVVLLIFAVGIAALGGKTLKKIGTYSGLILLALLMLVLLIAQGG